MVALQWTSVDAITPNARNARTHSKKQIRLCVPKTLNASVLMVESRLSPSFPKIISGCVRDAVRGGLGWQ